MPVGPPRDSSRSGRRKIANRSLLRRRVLDTRSVDILWRVLSAPRQVCCCALSMAPCRVRSSRKCPCTTWCHKGPRGCEKRALYCVRFESLSRPSSLADVTRRIPGKDLKTENKLVSSLLTNFDRNQLRESILPYSGHPSSCRFYFIPFISTVI